MERTMTLTPMEAMRGAPAAQRSLLPRVPTMAERVARRWILRGADGCGFDEIVGCEASRLPMPPAANRGVSH
ncbi:hypothetical protein ABL850_22760 [Variovorax paradoxus]|jgi:hypothetical protein|uniref:Uncharacterized protein n=1 Tax=Variovorax paradoxus TaxID=34073 RepID=A0A0H2LVZ2_VARPD|nr:hypothetical protein [Variovorax paradoxus]KLN52687.1 hypothetical protein VPARA_61800 [Variovorax paradoxus]